MGVERQLMAVVPALRLFVTDEIAIAGRPAPTGECGRTQILCPLQTHCRSEHARDEAGPSNITGG